MDKMVGLFLIFLVSVVTSQERCCAPSQWESYVIQSQGVYNHTATGPPSAQKVHMNVSMDYDIQRVAILFADDFLEGIRQVVDWTQDRLYYVYTDGTCDYYPMGPEDPPQCISDEAVPVRNTWMGFDTQQLHVDDWVWKAGDFNMTTTVTQPECLSVIQTFAGPVDETTMVSGGQKYTGNTLGIRDTSVFEIPSNCQPGPVKKIPKKRLPLAYITTMLGNPRKNSVSSLKEQVKPRSKLQNLIQKKLANL